MKYRAASLTLLVSFIASAQPVQNWTAIEPMNALRDSHGAATGPDGLVYAIGGSAQSTCLDSVEKYDTALHRWVPVAGMHVPRCNPGVVFGADGYIYAIGGDIGNTSTSLVERFDTRSGTWQDVAPLNTARGGPAVAVGPDLRIYAMGGYDEPGSTDLTSIEVFDGTQWTYVSEQTTLPSPRRAVTGMDGNIYAFSAAPANWSRFDGTTWTPLGPITPSDTNGDYDAVAGADGMLYLLGVGAGSPLSGSNRAVACDLAGNTTSIPSLLQSRSAAAAAMADGRIIISGGYRKGGGVLSNAESFGPVSAPILDNTTALFHFDEATGTTAIDSQGGPSGAIAGGAIYQDGPVGPTSIEFAGSKQYVKVNSSPALNFGARDFTIEAWVRWSPTGSSVLPIMDKRVQNGALISGYHFYIYRGYIGVQLANGATYRNYVAYGVPIPQNQWTHVAVTVERTAQNAGVFYVNSVRAGRFVPLAGSVSTSAPLLIGRNSLIGGPFRGGVDELTFYDRALRWSEIRAIFLAGREGKR